MSRFLLAAAAFVLTVAEPTAAQDAPLTTELLDRFVSAYDAERANLTAIEPELTEVDEKLKKFRECKTAFEAAGSASGSRLGGLAARAGIRAKCGANSEADIEKQRKAIVDKATADAAKGSGFGVPEFTRLKTRLERIYAYGDRAGLSGAEVEAVDARRERFASIYGDAAGMRAAAGAISAIGGGAAARPMPGQWTADLSWLYIQQLFGMMYATGANVFDGGYAPGQWTRWEMRGTDADEYGIVERAFLARTEDGNEWWRVKSIAVHRDGGRSTADTVILEGLFKPVSDGIQQLVRMRAKMPGDKEPNEMMVPEHMTTVSSLGMFGTRPTKESVDGATVGTESIKTPAGTFSAKRVRFGGAGGRQEWWLTTDVPGGWVRYQVTSTEDDESFVMELVAHGTGAKSELGVK